MAFSRSDVMPTLTGVSIWILNYMNGILGSAIDEAPIATAFTLSLTAVALISGVLTSPALLVVYTLPYIGWASWQRISPVSQAVTIMADIPVEEPASVTVQGITYTRETSIKDQATSAQLHKAVRDTLKSDIPWQEKADLVESIDAWHAASERVSKAAKAEVAAKSQDLYQSTEYLEMAQKAWKTEEARLMGARRNALARSDDAIEYSDTASEAEKRTFVFAQSAVLVLKDMQDKKHRTNEAWAQLQQQAEEKCKAEFEERSAAERKAAAQEANKRVKYWQERSFKIEIKAEKAKAKKA